jgi:hypothetical protein
MPSGVGVQVPPGLPSFMKKEEIKNDLPKTKKQDDSCPHCGMRAESEYFRDGQCICGYIVGMG